MLKMHEACLGRPPTDRTVTRYRKEASRGTWTTVMDMMARSMDSVERNFNLRHRDEPIPENEATKLYLFGE